MNTSIINFDYKGNQISFERGEDLMVNLTAMAKSYPEKNLSQIVNSQEIKEYIDVLTEIQNYISADLLIVRKGGDISQQGTWGHRLIAIRVAQKLDPALAVWVDMRIEELLRGGTQDSHGESQNVLPGFHSPQASMIGGHPVWTIPLEGELYYRLKDILNAAGIYEDKRKDTSRDWFKPHVYRINDRTGNVPHRYVRESGVLFLISRTRSAKGDSEVQRFLGSFVQKAKENRTPKAMPENPVKKGAEGIDLDKFLNIIVDIQDGETRGFLYNLYKILSRT